MFFFVHQKIGKSNCSDSASHPFSWDMSIVSALVNLRNVADDSNVSNNKLQVCNTEGFKIYKNM